MKIAFIIFVVLVFSGLCTLSEAETSGCLRCDDVTPGSPQEVRIEYKDGTARSACGLRCAGAMLAAYRMQAVKTIWVREHGSGKLLDAKKAFWVIWSQRREQGGLFGETGCRSVFNGPRRQDRKLQRDDGCGLLRDVRRDPEKSADDSTER